MATLGESLDPVEDDDVVQQKREAGFPQVLKYLSLADRMKKAIEEADARKLGAKRRL